MRALVAKAVAAELREGEVSLLSTETSASPSSFSQDELLALTPAYSDLYAVLIEAFAPALEARGLPPKAARTVLRDAVPSAVHFSLDRALRLKRFVAARGASGLAVSAPATAPLLPSRAEELRGAVIRSRDFNEWALGRFAAVLGLPTRPSSPSPALPPPTVEKGYVNFNFEGRGLWGKLRGKACRTAAKFVPGRIPALGLSYATFLLQDAGLIGPGRLEFVRGRAVFPAAAPDPARRAELQAVFSARVGELEAVLALGGAGDAAKPLAAACAALAAELFPADSWEGAPGHYAAAVKTLASFETNALILSETGNIEATYLIAAARARGFELIGVQEGGHYGYEDDYVAGFEMEYPHFDRYVTWGWTRFPEGRGMREVTAVVLPTPWLSERASQWRRDMGPGPSWWTLDRPHDLLLMSNKIYPYAPSPSGAAVSRSDHTTAFAAELKDLVARAKARGARILHKSYDLLTMSQLSGTLAELKVLGGDCYAHVERLDKGLHPALVARARMIVWDQPGTGFLECLTGGLPGMVLWSRLYNREVPWSREHFAALESVGLVHRAPETLLLELERYKAAPVAWMTEPARVAAARAFCAEYALTDPRWADAWKDLLTAACSRR